MFLSYLDSSGRPTYNDDKENFVLTSVTINEHQWYSLREKIENLKKTYFPQLPSDKVEFHAKDMMNRSGIYKDLSWATIYEILDSLFAIISDKESRLTIISALIKKCELRKQIDLEQWAHRFVFERLNSYLQTQNDIFAQVGLPHEYGIMIIDSEDKKKDQKLRDKLYDMLNNGTFYSDLNYLIEDPLFTDSKWRNLSQLADCICYCIRKKYRINTDSFHNDNWYKFYELIEPKFHQKNGNYLGYGLKIFP